MLALGAQVLAAGSLEVAGGGARPVSGVTLPVPEATVQISDGHVLSTDDAGRTSVTLLFDRTGARRMIVTDPEYFDGHATVTVSPMRRS